MERFERPGIRGYLHEPSAPPKASIAIAHGAGGNCETPLIKTLATAFADAEFLALRFDLPYRQAGRGGPHPSAQARDREGIELVATTLRELHSGPLYLSGHSYGGRMTTVLAASNSNVADALLLLSYPLHPPGQPAKLRVEHFPSLKIPSLFVHGTRDPFGSIDELQSAIRGIPARTRLAVAEGAPHGVPPKLAPKVVEWFLEFLK